MTAFLHGVGHALRFDKRWFFPFYLLVGLPYLLLTGPFRAADERNHFLRAYEISEGRWNSAHVLGEFAGDELPLNLLRLSEVLGYHADHHIEMGQIAAARALFLNPKERVFIEFSTAVYSPVAYVPSAIAIDLGRVLGAGPLALVYFGRCANLVVGGGLITLALSYAGYARRTMFLVAVLPMTVSQVATLTADAMSYGFGFLWISLVIHSAVAGSEGTTRNRIFLLVGLGLALSQLRPPYPLLGLLALLLPTTAFSRKTVLVSLALLASSLLPAVAWNAAATRLLVQTLNPQTVKPIEQARWVAKHPGIFWHRAKQDLKAHGVDYWQQFVGRLGWLNIWLPSWIYIGFALALAVGIFVGPRGPPALLLWQRLAIGLAALGGVLAIQFMLYLTFNPVRSPFILGIQGRYFTPLAVLAAFAFSNSLLSRPLIEPVYKLGCLLFVVSAHCGSVFAVARASGKI
jgi:uncharacterized membrane protein